MALHQLADKRRLSHAYILSSPAQERQTEAAHELAAAVLCSAPGEKACGTCRDCRKLRQGTHPDVVIVRPLVDDKGREKAEISVAQIRQLVAEAHVLPNEAERKIYIIEKAEKLNKEAQNAALKLLEEPPARLVLALCTSNALSLLPTVRSRCIELNMVSQAEDADEQSMKLAKAYIKRIADKKAWEICAFCLEHEEMDTASARLFVQSLRRCAVDMLARRDDTMGLSGKTLMEICALAEKCEDYLKVNTGIKHIFGLLAAFDAGEE